LAVPHFRQVLGSSQKWLSAIDTAAVEQRLPVQFCMALPSDLMASLQFNGVTNYRASDDYAGVGNFDVAGSALLAFALGLRPSKDTFWTQRPASAAATGHPWGPHDNPGSNCELNLLIATLSTGPVGISDKAGNTNKTLLMHAMRPDGWLIQPDRPVTPVDASFMQPNFVGSRPPPPGHVWATTASIPGAGIWHYVLAIDVRQRWQLSSKDLYPDLRPATGWIARCWHHEHAPSSCTSGSVAPSVDCDINVIESEADMPWLLNTRPIMVANDTHVFDLMQFAPIGNNGWVFLGDLTRYVSVTKRRFRQVLFTEAGMRITVEGVAGETLVLTALQPVVPTKHNKKKSWVSVIGKLVFSKSEEQIINFGSSSADRIWI